MSLIEALASALRSPADDLMNKQPPSRAGSAGVALSQAQRTRRWPISGCRRCGSARRFPATCSEHILALHTELRRQRPGRPRHARGGQGGNADLRLMMRDRGNYFAEIEAAAAEALAPVGYSGGALSQGMLLSAVSHHGFSVRYVQDLPRSARSVTDLRNRRISLRQESLGMHTPRAPCCCRRSATRARPLGAC